MPSTSTAAHAAPVNIPPGMEEVRTLREAAELRRDLEIRYELASRTLAALYDRLFAGIAREERDLLWNTHYISDFAGIRAAHDAFERRKAIARRNHEQAPQPSDFDRAVARVCESEEVDRHWAVIASLKRDAGVAEYDDELDSESISSYFTDEAAPAVSDFISFAQRIGLSSGMRDDLAHREYYAHGVGHRYFRS
ncbi:hypothetical protein BDZ89DRAFT_1138527 [Hymenopellis radicata]|nr:hypothetical protein BDZ89DRAFT_1138527 [Hymenopellis radicata]